MSALRPRARRAPLLLALAAALLPHADRVAGGGGGGSMFGDVNISSILDSFSISYDKRVRPNYGGPPVEVGVTMYVLSISSVSEVLMDFTLDFYFRQFWTDPRLAYKKRAGVETLSVGSEFIRNIWVPDTFFVNEKQSYFHTATTSNEFIRIHHSGSITRSIRLTITASCPMNLQYFPMDRQLCHIEIESFGYTMTDILYVWKDGASSVGMSSEVQLPQFRVLGHRQRATVITLSTVGYTMRDIRYKWNEGPNSVGVSNEVSLPQFKVLGHRQRAMEISLTTGANHFLNFTHQLDAFVSIQSSFSVAVCRANIALYSAVGYLRKLLAVGVRDPVRAVDGLLPDPDLHPVRPDRDHIVGLILAEPQRDAGARAARRHHRAHDDHAHVFHKRGAAQDLLRQVHRRLPRHLFRDGVHQSARVRHGGVHVQADTDEKAEVRGDTKDNVGEEDAGGVRAAVGRALAQQGGQPQSRRAPAPAPLAGRRAPAAAAPARLAARLRGPLRGPLPPPAGGALQGARPQGALQGRHARELARGQPRALAAHAAPHQGLRQVLGHDAVRHRQVLAHRVPGVLRVLQPDVLDRVPARVRRGGRRPGAAGGEQVKPRPHCTYLMYYRTLVSRPSYTQLTV